MPWTTLANSNIGARDEQQDRYLVVSNADGSCHLLAVADGAGGHKYGAMAAQTAIECIQDKLAELWLSDDPTAYLNTLILECNKRVLALGQDDLACSTLVLVFIKNDELFWGHVGDSRFYLIRGHEVVFQTTDHSVIEFQKQQSEQGAEMLTDAPANELYMCLGAMPEIDPCVDSGLAREGDVLLLCSDGLWGQLEMDRLVAELGESPWEIESVNRWMAKARATKLELSDNITMVVAKYEPKPSFIMRVTTVLFGWLKK